MPLQYPQGRAGLRGGRRTTGESGERGFSAQVDRSGAHRFAGTAGGLMMRWVRIGLLALLVVVVFTYAADWVIFKIEGSPTSKFTVSYFVTAPLKNNKEERDYLGSEEV